MRSAAAAVAVAGTVAALLPIVATAAIPKASWYWTLSAGDPNTLLLGTSAGLYRSTDAGKTWQPAGTARINATSVIQSAGTVLVGGIRTRAGSKAVMVVGGAYISGPGTSVVEASTDGGKTWEPRTPRGLPNIGVQALAVDPADDSVIYAVVRNGALYRSTDGGDSFRLVAATVGGTPWAIAVTNNHHFVTGDMTSGSYLSSTGDRWLRTNFADPKGGSMVMEYAVQPTDAHHILMTSYGVLASKDAGKTWSVALKSKVMFGPVAWALSTPTVAYAVGWNRSLWRSDDGGRSWRRTS